MRLDSTTDPLMTHVLGLVQAAVNADFKAEDASFESDEAIKSTFPYPIEFSQGLGDLAMPALGCHRKTTREKRFSAVHTDKVSTFRFTYMTPACAKEQIDDRWPLLENVWQKMVDALNAGHHPDYLNDAPVLVDAGVIRIAPDSFTKQEFFADSGTYAFPSFWGECEVTWRDPNAQDTSDLHPMLSARGKLFTDGHQGTPDVVFDAYTPLGLEARDAEPYESEAELGGE